MAQTFDTTYEILLGQYALLALIIILVVLSILCYIDAIYNTIFPAEQKPSHLRSLYIH